jgi:hypothetical protein
MHLVPVGFRNQPVIKLSIASGITTISSNSRATLGTGLVAVPVYGWVSASVAGGNFAVLNGTAGSILFRGVTSAGGVEELQFWESPGALAQGKCPVIETTGNVGINEFHVYYIVCRGGIGAGATVQ